ISAAEKGNAPAVAVLLSAGSRPNKLYRGKSALHLAVAKAHADAVVALLAGGANHLLPDKDGVTALDVARKRRRKAVLALLEAAEASRVAVPTG
ncbi:MAG: ankyrin repeat domain-containing protein, partial [Akkermansiaceae bacterium]|nr:ankyrin repeat domain-containing protein [Armatimonadota bacterium]